MKNRKQIATISGPKCHDVLLCSMEEEQESKKRADRNLDTQKAEMMNKSSNNPLHEAAELLCLRTRATESRSTLPPSCL
jgi:hypothetical protein